MSVTELLRQRNTDFASRRPRDPLPRIPALSTVIVACSDPRVDPAHVLGLELGEAAVIRNAGGRITPAALQTVAIMAMLVAESGEPGGLELIVVHHTDCGVARLATHEDLLASYFEIPVEELPSKHLTEPARAVEADIDSLRSNPVLPDDLVVSGLVYDVETGEVTVAVAPGPLRPG